MKSTERNEINMFTGAGSRTLPFIHLQYFAIKVAFVLCLLVLTKKKPQTPNIAF